jgi:hypothetical protein
LVELGKEIPWQNISSKGLGEGISGRRLDRPCDLAESKDPESERSAIATSGNSDHPSQTKRDEAGGDNIPPLTTRQSQRWNEIKKLEASIENAMHGDWREMRTVFNAVGLTPGNSPRLRRNAGVSEAGVRSRNPEPSEGSGVCAPIVKRPCASKPMARISPEIRPEP